MQTLNKLTQITDAQFADLCYCDAYADYIMDNCAGERVCGNGDMLIELMEELYLFKDFIATLGLEDANDY